MQFLLINFNFVKKKSQFSAGAFGAGQNFDPPSIWNGKGICLVEIANGGGLSPQSLPHHLHSANLTMSSPG